MKRLSWNRELKWGAALLLFLSIVALSAPWLTRLDPNLLYDDMLSPPNAVYWFGTDGLGRDVYSMVIYGTRASLLVGITVAVLSSLIGVVLGSISGYMGGMLDRVLSELLNICMMMPTFFILLIVIAVYGSSLKNMVIVMAVTSWVGTARLMRGQAIALKQRGFVLSARALGESHVRILLTHIIPNGVFPVVANAAMTVASAILAEAGLSFLGLGDPNVISWGKIIAQGRAYLPSCWWICMAPGVAIIMTAFAFYLLGDGVNRWINRHLN